MEKIQSVMSRLVREEDGAAAAEYAILVAAVAAAVSLAVGNFNLGGIFTSVSTKVNGLVTGAGSAG